MPANVNVAITPCNMGALLGTICPDVISRIVHELSFNMNNVVGSNPVHTARRQTVSDEIVLS